MLSWVYNSGHKCMCVDWLWLCSECLLCAQWGRLERRIDRPTTPCHRETRFLNTSYSAAVTSKTSMSVSHQKPLRCQQHRTLPLWRYLTCGIFPIISTVKKKSGTCCNACCVRWTCRQKCFTISELAANWHELMILQCTNAAIHCCVSEQLDPRLAASGHTTTPISYTRPLPPSSYATNKSHPWMKQMQNRS